MIKDLFWLVLPLILIGCELPQPGKGAKGKSAYSKNDEFSSASASVCSNSDTETRVFYREHIVGNGADCTEVIKSAICQDGAWRFPDTGETLYTFCIEKQNVYPSQVVSFQETCIKSNIRERVCSDGTCGAWEGQVGYTNCEQSAPSACGNTDHGELAFMGYHSAIVSSSSGCQSAKVQGVCNNGQWDSLDWSQGDPLYSVCYDQQSDLSSLFKFLDNCPSNEADFEDDQSVTLYLEKCHKRFKKMFMLLVND
jgi:hypothetical protein